METIILEANKLFKNFKSPWFICGGFALDMFVGKQLRIHGDFDICSFREHKVEMLQFMQHNGWDLYARFLDLNDPDTHGTIRTRGKKLKGNRIIKTLYHAYRMKVGNG